MGPDDVALDGPSEHTIKSAGPAPVTLVFLVVRPPHDPQAPLRGPNRALSAVSDPCFESARDRAQGDTRLLASVCTSDTMGLSRRRPSGDGGLAARSAHLHGRDASHSSGRADPEQFCEFCARVARATQTVAQCSTIAKLCDAPSDACHMCRLVACVRVASQRGRSCIHLREYDVRRASFSRRGEPRSEL